MTGADRYTDALAGVRAYHENGRDGRELAEAQVGWYREQAESFAAYLRQKAGEARHLADTTADEAERETALADEKKLLADADGVRTVWPYEPIKSEVS